MRSVISLSAKELLIETNWGGYVVAPSSNVDVTIGVTRDGVHESSTTRLVQELLRSGQKYLNAGANFGYYVALAGRIVGEGGVVIGVEPNPHILPFLLKTIYWNGSPNCTRIVRRALSDTDGQKLTFEFDPQYLGGGHMAAETYVHGKKIAHTKSSIEDALWSASNIGEVFDEDGIWSSGSFLYVKFEAVTAKISTLCQKMGVEQLDLLHLDIEGAEPLALAGAEDVIRNSPKLRLITEWSHMHYQKGSETIKSAFDHSLGFLRDLGYLVRKLDHQQNVDGGLRVSEPLSDDFLRCEAIHGDYVWTLRHDDHFNR